MTVCAVCLFRALAHAFVSSDALNRRLAGDLSPYGQGSFGLSTAVFCNLLVLGLFAPWNIKFTKWPKAECLRFPTQRIEVPALPCRHPLPDAVLIAAWRRWLEQKEDLLGSQPAGQIKRGAAENTVEDDDEAMVLHPSVDLSKISIALGTAAMSCLRGDFAEAKREWKISKTEFKEAFSGVVGKRVGWWTGFKVCYILFAGVYAPSCTAGVA